MRVAISESPTLARFQTLTCCSNKRFFPAACKAGVPGKTVFGLLGWKAVPFQPSYIDLWNCYSGGRRGGWC
jgi:hypothetical protein